MIEGQRARPEEPAGAEYDWFDEPYGVEDDDDGERIPLDLFMKVLGIEPLGNRCPTWHADE